ncbi:MAG: flagellar type III secretion system pore protein FliP [Myxococcales bacterium]|nr:flagellar type III secretion system pore protein FliP [Myxococcales bacterium]
MPLRRPRPLSILLALGVTCTLLLIGSDALAQVSSSLPRIDISLGGGGGGPKQVSSALKILALLTVLSLAPAILMLMTAFTRIVIVLSFVRQSLGVQGMPPNQVIVGLSLLLTIFVMAPAAKKAHSQGLGPYLAGKLGEKQAIEKTVAPFREFMLDHTRTKDLEFFLDLSGGPLPKSRAEVPLSALVPAFVISELTAAFHMGFLVFIPFVLLDFVIGSVLMSMGMVMLPPALVSLPLKVMLFVLVDGWHLVVTSLVRSVS